MRNVLETAAKAVLSVFGYLNRQNLIDLTGRSDRTVGRYLAEAQTSGQLRYDPSKKRMVPQSGQSSVGGINEHLRYIRACQAVHHTANTEPLISILDAPATLEPNLDYRAVQTVCQALRDKRQVSCHYFSKTKGLKHYILSPLHLVYISYRYHLRAYIHESDRYADFVLGRFESVDKLPRKAVSDAQDKRWHSTVALKFSLNLEQQENTQESARWEWHLPGGQSTITIETTGALQNYVVRQMTANDYQTGKPIWVHEENQNV